MGNFLTLTELEQQQAFTEGYQGGPEPFLNTPNVNTQIALGNPAVSVGDPPPYYPGALVTPSLGLSLIGMSIPVAENMVLLDAAIVPSTGGEFSGAIMAPSLIVTGTGTFDTLSTISNLAVNGTLTDIQGHSGYTGAVLTFTPGGVLWATSLGSLSMVSTNFLEGLTLDMQGTLTMTNPAKTAAYSYSSTNTDTSAPTVVVTATGADPSALGGVWVTNQGSAGAWTGFTINCTSAPGSTATFNYIVIGNQA